MSEACWKKLIVVDCPRESYMWSMSGVIIHITTEAFARRARYFKQSPTQGFTIKAKQTPFAGVVFFAAQNGPPLLPDDID